MTTHVNASVQISPIDVQANSNGMMAIVNANVSRECLMAVVAARNGTIICASKTKKLSNTCKIQTLIDFVIF